MQPETRFKLKVVKRLRDEFGPDVFFYKTQQVSLGGIPDIVGCLRGRFFAFELKTTDRAASPLQEYILDQIRFARGFACVVHPANLEETLRLLKDWVSFFDD